MKKNIKILLIIVISAGAVFTLGISIPIAILLNKPQFELTELGQIDTGGEAHDVDVEGTIAYVIDTTENNPGGLVIIDISDPTHPIKLGSYFEGGLPRSVEVHDDIAYVANQFEGLEIINISDPSHPNKIGEYVGSGSMYDVQIVNEIAYVADWNRGLVLLDVSDPSHPSLLSRKAFVGACVHLHVLSNYAYVIDHHSRFSGLKVIDISDPNRPSEEGSFVRMDVDLWNPYACGNYVYAANHGNDAGELYILDVSDPSNIIQAGVYDVYPDQTMIGASHVIGNIAYLADYTQGLKILDVTNPANPEILGQYSDGGHGFDIQVVGDIAYMADQYDGLEIIQISQLN